MPNIFYIDGAFVSDEQAHIPANDLGVIRGFGVFDFTRTYNRQPFHLVEHVRRLQISSEQIGLALPHSLEDICNIVMETLDKNDHPESYIRIVSTGGVSPNGITPQGNSSLIVMVTPVIERPAWWQKDGIKVITTDIQRLYPTVKSTNYIPAIMAQAEARTADAIEALYTKDGYVQEGTTTNLFIVKNGTLITPPETDVLQGVTRMVVLSLAEGNYPIEVRPVSVDELKSADEVFITSSTKEIVPVVQVDDTTIADGTPQATTRDLLHRFKQYAKAYRIGV